MDSPGISEREAAEAINQQASVEMKRGIALLDENTPASLTGAIGHFDRAIELRSGLPLDANPFFRHGLAAGWMNRGDALTRPGSAADLTTALQSYDTALEVLSLLPLDQNPLFRRRLAIAWQNRGVTLQAQGGFGEAAKSFGETIGILQDEKAAAIADRDYLLATAWMNRANAFVHGHENYRAMNAAKQALGLAQLTEATDLTMAAVGLTARHILCQAMAVIIAAEKLNDAARNDLLIEATDAVDEGMALARSWCQRGADQFRPLARQLFIFGARTYESLQSRFLGEFLLENLDPSCSADAYSTDSVMHTVAREALERLCAEIQRHDVKTLDALQLDALCTRLRDLRALKQRLDNLRKEYLLEN